MSLSPGAKLMGRAQARALTMAAVASSSGWPYREEVAMDPQTVTAICTAFLVVIGIVGLIRRE